jgi:hypothetical protein
MQGVTDDLQKRKSGSSGDEPFGEIPTLTRNRKAGNSCRANPRIRLAQRNTTGKSCAFLL